MDAKMVAIVGLIGGILAAAGVFGAWATAGGVSSSGWDLTKALAEGGMSAKLPYVALVGGVLAVIGAILALAKPSVVCKVLLAIGGMMALMGVATGLFMMDAGAVTEMFGGVSIETGYGTYLVVIGGILAILSTLGLKEKA